MPPPNSPEQPKLSKAPVQDHEKSDVPVKWLFVIVLCLAVFGIGLHFILSGMMQNLQKTTPLVKDPYTAPRSLAQQPLRPPTNWPLLQLSPPTDLEAFRNHEDADLKAYRWINRTNGTVQIPITRAMDLLVQKQLLPVRKSNTVGGAKSPWELEQQRAVQRQPGTKETR